MKLFTLLLFPIVLTCACQTSDKVYVCPPCDLKCDLLTHSKPGHCPHCKMELVLKSELESETDYVVNKIEIRSGSGAFLIDGGAKRERRILIRYHQPQSYNRDSEVIIVLPGAGRNAKDYRDAWVEGSEKYGVLVLVPEYSEEYYPEFWSYNLAGMIYDVDIQNETFKINRNPEEWIFEDFDRMFNLAREKLGFETNRYDMFGHSAGGQILNRLALFKPQSQANRILASNSGWYTLPDQSEAFPYGTRDLKVVIGQGSFDVNLVLFLGEMDDANETRGHLRRSPEVDKQGLHRLARGTHFYEQSKQIAESKNLEFNWKLEVIPGIGHDYRGMSEHAARYLYANDN